MSGIDKFEEKFEFEVDNPQLFKHLKEICKPTGKSTINVDLSKLSEELESSCSAKVNCTKINETEINVSYKIKPNLVRVILKEYDNFLELIGCNLVLNRDERIDEFIGFKYFGLEGFYDNL